MSQSEISGRTAFFKAFVFLIAFFVVSGWILSIFHALQWAGVVAVPGMTIAAILFHKNAQGSIRTEVIVPLLFWPLLILAALMLLRSLLYPPTMLDSLTYRLPRILVWLQDGSVHHFQSAEDRLNYMPQVWGLSAIPLLKWGGERVLWIWSFVSGILLYLLAYDWAWDKTKDTKRSRVLAFIGTASTYTVLQAGSTATDLFASVFALLGLHFVVRFEKTRNWWEINWAALCLGLASGGKPHFAVFGLPFVVWFLASSSKPWRIFQWRWIPVLLPLWLVCSPVPAFHMNQRTYGTVAGPGQDYSMTGKGPGWNILAGGTMILWQTFQPPVNPAALLYNQRLEQKIEESGIRNTVPRFRLDTPPIAMVDVAGLGLVTSVLLVVGIVVAIRRDPGVTRSWAGWAAAAGLAAILLALSRFVSGGSGRAFAGFLYFGLPLSIAGWIYFRPKALTAAVWFSFLSGLAALILSPNRPLWPARSIHQAFASSGSSKLHKISELMQPYLLVRERASTGTEIMQAIPENQDRVVVLVAPDRPLWPLLNASSVDRRFLFLPPHASIAELEKLGASYVITGGPVDLIYDDICEQLDRSGKYEMVLSRDYTSKLVRGAEHWKLYRKVMPITGSKGGQDEPATIIH